MKTFVAMAIAVWAGCSSNDDDGGPAFVDWDAAVCPTPIQNGEQCAAFETRSCPIEGTGVCDQEPAGGSCTCSGGAWSCYSGCAPGCPAQQPTEGAACTLDDGVECRYWYPQMGHCTCSGGTFHCS